MHRVTECLLFFARFKPFILSVWGSDVYDFPTKNLFNKFLINKIIKKADIVCSTSNEMKKLVEKEFQRYDVKIVPFGIDSNLFIPKHDPKMKFTAGTIKSIEKHNGISCLLDAAKIIIHDHKKNINFLIVGEGSLKNKMKKKH